jgi:hypothetical protein
MSSILRVIATSCPKCKKALPEPIELFRREIIAADKDDVPSAIQAVSVETDMPANPRRRRQNYEPYKSHKRYIPSGKYDIRDDPIVYF